MNAGISETTKARKLGFGMQNPDLLAQFVSSFQRPQTAQNCGAFSFYGRK